MAGGVPLNQAMVQAGGEPTDPRSFDPATTLSTGDKRVFSGLVSFDPSLRLTPDLAERREVSPDADVLFHSGSPQNNGRYSNPQLDRLLEAGRVEQDVTKRIEMYQQAEPLIVDDAAAFGQA